MIEPSTFFQLLSDQGVRYFTGVPDSLLKEFCGFAAANLPEDHHVIAANEGAAVALAAGYHLATGRMGAVYMQNSGLGNAVNPLLSLADPEVYAIPMLLIIGWRGEVGVKDEPQHRKQGRVMPAMLDAMEIPYEILDAQTPDVAGLVARLCDRARSECRPVAIAVRKGTFQSAASEARNQRGSRLELTRERAIAMVAHAAGEESVIVCTTGKPSRELFEFRAARNEDGGGDFLTVGSMGHASQIALAMAQQRPERRVICIDGDGAMLMHMGALAIIGAHGPANFRHVILNNGAHESVGGQPTVAFGIDIPALARTCGYRHADTVSSEHDLNAALHSLLDCDGPALLEIQVNLRCRDDLGRPTRTPIENKQRLMDSLLVGMQRTAGGSL